MRTIAAMIAGLALSGLTFVSGVLIASIYISKPEHSSMSRNDDVTSLWTVEPVVVDTARQPLERVASRPVAMAQLEKSDPAINKLVDWKVTAGKDNVDPTITGSINDTGSVRLGHAHSEWCSRRYNSYRSEDDTYQPYQGERRRCASPFLTAGAAVSTASVSRIRQASDSAAVVEVGLQYADKAHARKCTARYRSYRPEDNSYQPYDGGPRRQCI